MDYKEKYIELNRAVSDLKRGKETSWALEILGYEKEDFDNVNQYLAANAFEVKDRKEFIKRLKNLGVDLFAVHYIKNTLDQVRTYLERKPDDSFLLAAEMILTNLLFMRDTYGAIPALVNIEDYIYGRLKWKKI